MLKTQAQPQHHAGFNDENMASVMQSPNSKKRKRPSTGDAPADSQNNAKRPSLTQTNGNSDHINGTSENFNESTSDFTHINNDGNPEQDISNTAAAALTAHLSAPDTQNLPFANAGSSSNDRQLDDSFNLGDSTQAQTQGSPYGLSQYDSNSMAQNRPDSSNGPKPAVGTDEWHKVRRDNHKEVERRRRETINEGINELAKIVPGCEKNKGQILARAVTYINELKQREDTAGEKKVLEKVVLEQAVQELMTRNEDLQNELRRFHKENELLKKRVGNQYDVGERRNSASENES